MNDLEQARRYARQIMLPQIGRAGQSRIQASKAAVAGVGQAHEMATLYAQRAGFGAVVPGQISVTQLAPDAVISNQPARDMVAACRATLHALRLALELK